jgi:hypothetical protein
VKRRTRRPPAVDSGPFPGGTLFLAENYRDLAWYGVPVDAEASSLVGYPLCTVSPPCNKQGCWYCRRRTGAEW